MTAVLTILIGLLAGALALLWINTSEALRNLKAEIAELKRADDEHRHTIGVVDEKIVTLAARIEPVEGVVARETDLCERVAELAKAVDRAEATVAKLKRGVSESYASVFEEFDRQEQG